MVNGLKNNKNHKNKVRNHRYRTNILKGEDVAESIVHMIRLNQRAMVSEIDIRTSNFT